MSLGERTADAKRILGLMGLGVKQGDLVKLTVEGEDEDAAALKLKAFMWENF
jgi:phosphocarrier protein